MQYSFSDRFETNTLTKCHRNNKSIEIVVIIDKV